MVHHDAHPLQTSVQSMPGACADAEDEDGEDGEAAAGSRLRRGSMEDVDPYEVLPCCL